MKKSIKKFFVIGVISAIIMNQSIMPAMASCKTMDVEKEEISNEQEDTQISEIDDLMEKKCETLIQKDNTNYESINNELEEKGVETMSLSQIIKLTGEVPKLDSDGSTEQNFRAASAATFQTQYSTYTYKNKKYKVMRVYATPNGKTGPLYKTGNSTVKNSKSLEATAMEVIKIISSNAIGYVNKPLSITQTAYSIASEFSNYLSKTSVVSDIKGSYTWAAAETCVFVYFQSPTISGAWNLKGQYSKASVAVGVSIPTLKAKGKKAIAKILQKSYNKTVTPQNYNSTQKAFEAYKNGGTYKAIGVSKINITGIEGKKVGTIKLSNQPSPSGI